MFFEPSPGRRARGLGERNRAPVNVLVALQPQGGDVRSLVRGLVGDQRVVCDLDLTAEPREVGPLEDDEDIHGIGRRRDLVRREPNRARRLASPDLRP